MKILSRPERARAGRLVLFSAAAATALAAGSARAADPAPLVGAASASSVDEVVVIARKETLRTAEIQETPAAITSVGAEKLEQQNITNVRELGNIAPNLFQARTAVSYSNSSFFIRGVGEPDAQGEPSVAIYFDGGYHPKNLGAQQELLDIETVEVLRGPQGQAFGHAASAGALLINSTIPGPDKTFRAQAAYGTDNEFRVGAAASGPIAENIFGGLAASYHRRDGFTHNVTTGSDLNDIDYLAGRGKLRFTPTDRLDIVLSLSGLHDKSTARGVQTLDYGDKNARNQIDAAQDYKQVNFVGTVDYALSDRLKLTSITAAAKLDQTAAFDNTGDYYGRGSQLVVYEDKTWSQELRLHGDFDRLSFVAGAYYYREEWFTNRRANTAVTPNTSVVANIRYRPVYSLVQQNTDNYALFGEAKYRLTDRLTATLGVRYNDERHSNDISIYNLVAAAPYQTTAANFLQVLRYGQPQGLAWREAGSKSWQTWSPKAAVDFQWTSDILQYVSYSEGTKSAGYDYRAQTPTATGALQARYPFDPEIVRNYETGLKSEFLDGRFRFNAAAFLIKFDDIQITTTNPLEGVSRRFNAGNGTTKGVEVETSIVPGAGLQIDLSASYLKARLDDFRGATPTIQRLANGQILRSGPFAGAVLPNAPEVQARLAATYQLPLNISGRVILQGDASYQSESYTDATNNFSVRLPPQTYLNASVTYTTEDGRWSVVLSGRNLADKQYALPPGYVADAAGNPVYRTTNYNDPRQVLLTLRYRQ